MTEPFPDFDNTIGPSEHDSFPPLLNANDQLPTPPLTQENLHAALNAASQDDDHVSSFHSVSSEAAPPAAPQPDAKLFCCPLQATLGTAVEPALNFTVHSLRGAENAEWLGPSSRQRAFLHWAGLLAPEARSLTQSTKEPSPAQSSKNSYPLVEVMKYPLILGMAPENLEYRLPIARYFALVDGECNGDGGQGEGAFEEVAYGWGANRTMGLTLMGSVLLQCKKHKGNMWEVNFLGP